MTGNPDDTTPRPPSPDPQRVIQTEPEQCDACDMPMALYAQLTNPDKGIAYAVIGATKDIHGLEVWYECDECDAVEELGFLDDLAPAEVEALRTFAAGQGWTMYHGDEAEFRQLLDDKDKEYREAERRAGLAEQRRLQRMKR